MGEQLYASIGSPHSPTVLLLPLRLNGKAIAVIYGDFGARKPVPVRLQLLELLAAQAELQLENVYLRKKTAPQGVS